MVIRYNLMQQYEIEQGSIGFWHLQVKKNEDGYKSSVCWDEYTNIRQQSK